MVFFRLDPLSLTVHLKIVGWFVFVLNYGMFKGSLFVLGCCLRFDGVICVFFFPFSFCVCSFFASHSLPGLTAKTWLVLSEMLFCYGFYRSLFYVYFCSLVRFFCRRHLKFIFNTLCPSIFGYVSFGVLNPKHYPNLWILFPV